ncbi:MAG: hypothetical protein D6822_00160 [Cyanobacteria bacterium J149]|nr:MAG: hypothetical protein D6822_00160 [Cyanobacteria bacterium J149]
MGGFWYNISMDIDAVAASVKYDDLVLKALLKIGKKYDIAYKNYLLKVYGDRELHSLYNAMREQAKLEDKLSKPKDKWLVVKFPSQTVFKFLDDLFRPKYGDNWLHDKKTFVKVCKKEELIKPWLIRKP